MNHARLLRERHCIHGAPALDEAALAALLPQVPEWQVEDDHLQREYAFRDYHETVAFVNALAWMIHQQDHHPQLWVRYRHCGVAWTTHSAGNRVSENDFICAAKADAIYTERTNA
jgi:4a-hydroxytetrahydrobiopterin dehydratase